MSKQIFFYILVLMLFITACIKPPEYSNVPELTYRGINKSEVYQGSNTSPNDTLIVEFDFTDGDGDLGTNDSIDIYLTDSRIGSPSFFRIPDITNEGSANGISGTITIKIENKPANICCIFTNGEPPCSSNGDLGSDSYFYTIKIRDRANNWSNEIQTEIITILCE